jgi:hypothetical protein
MTCGTPGVRVLTRYARAAAIAVAVVLGACGQESDPVETPVLPPNQPGNPELTASAFIFDIDVKGGEVKVLDAATRGTVSALRSEERPSGKLANGRSLLGPDFSIVGGDVVELVTTAFAVTAGGGFASGTIPVGPCPGGAPAAQPGRLCVEFDVAVINELLGVQLVGPVEFPAPPAGSTGPVFFPFDIAVTETAGGATPGGTQGNDIIVELPNNGSVSVSDEWAGAPHNFFNDVNCAATPAAGTAIDCYRWEEITPTPLTGGAQSNAQRVGFYVDPTVGNFRVRILVGADLQNQSGAASGSIAGSVTSPQLGALAGVTVTVSGVAGTQNTGAAGAYNFATVGLGSRTVSISGLPGGCTNPGSQGTTVTNGTTSTVNFTVTCGIPVGTITGTISSSLGGGMAGIGVIATPTAGTALPAVNTSAAGAYSIGGVAIGGGALTLTNVPANCTNPGATPYTGVTNGGTITVDITLTCTAPPSVYIFSGTWSTVGSNRNYRLAFDLTQRDDPAIPGADDISVISALTAYDNTRLAFASSANVPGSGMTNQNSNEVTPGVVAWLQFNSGATALTGVVGIIDLSFTVVGGATGTLTPSTTFQSVDDVLSLNGTNLRPNTQIVNGTLTF